MLSSNNYIDKVIGNYRIITGLATGESCSIYMAQHTAIPKVTVAIKIFHNTPVQSRDLFFREIRLRRMLKHPHILPMLDAGIFEDAPYLITEYAPQGSLRERIQRQGPALFPTSEVITILAQVGQALTYAHHFNIVHGNIKPENILFSSAGQVLLTDFSWTTMSGPAWMQGGSTSVVSLQELNSARYMALEQFQGFTSRRSDQYALGCVAYELLTRQVPFSAPDIASLQRMHTAEEPAPPTQFNLLLPPRIEGGVLKALAKSSEDRHPNIESFIASLSPASAVQPAPPQKTPANGYPSLPTPKVTEIVQAEKQKTPVSGYPPVPAPKVAEIVQAEKQADTSGGMLAQPAQQPAALIEAPAPTSGAKEKSADQDAAIAAALAAVSWPQAPEDLPEADGVQPPLPVSASADGPAPLLAQEIAHAELPVPIAPVEQEEGPLPDAAPDIEASMSGEPLASDPSQALPIEAQTTARMEAVPVDLPELEVAAPVIIETSQFIPVDLPREPSAAHAPVLLPASSVTALPARAAVDERPALAGGFGGQSGKSAGSQRKWPSLLVVIALVAAIVTLLAFILPPVLSTKTATVSSRPTATRVPEPTSTPTLVPTATPKPVPKSIPPRPPRPTPTPSPTPKPTATPVPGLVAAPTQINANSGCSGGGGNFMCNVTLSLPANARTPVPWVASSSNVVAFFNPPNDTLNPGSQQQVSIHVYSSCPNTGATLVFSTSQKTVTVLWSC